jgi:endonuclease/exonuclease/phosphatase (EEP) superfamily protein YafD
VAVTWFVIVVLGVTAFARSVGFDGRASVVVLASAAPTSFLLAYPALIVAAVGRRRFLAVAAICAITVQLSWFAPMLPGVHGPGSLPAGASKVRVLTANLFFFNAHGADFVGTVEKAAPDVIAVQEYTYINSSEFTESAVFAQYPYRVLLPTYQPDGIALFSKLPLTAERRLVLGGRKAIQATLATPAGPVSILVVHTIAPVDDSSTAAWSRQMNAIKNVARDIDGPLIVAGDLNATPGNRAYAELADVGKVHDVLSATGSGYAMTWPADRFLPPFVRPDHVLVGRGVSALDGYTVGVRGSDHRGIVADVGIPRQP